MNTAAASPDNDLSTEPRDREWPWLFALVALVVVATFPGWLPGRVYVPRPALDKSTPAGRWVARTTVAAEQLRRGQAPLWDPSTGLGEPLLERGAVRALSPLILPHVF